MSNVRFIHDGNKIDHTPLADVAAGDVVVQGDLVGIAKLDIPAGSLGALAVTGVFDFPKATISGSAIPTGSKVYWDAADKLATTDSDSGANKYIGKAIRAATDADPTVRIRLEQ
jgi:predicted RecA/RadA family phage recombinase